MIWFAALLQLAGLALTAATMHATPKRLRVPSQRLRLAVAGGRALLLLSAVATVGAVGWPSLLLYWFGLLPFTGGIVLATVTRVRPAR